MSKHKGDIHIRFPEKVKKSLRESLKRLKHSQKFNTTLSNVFRQYGVFLADMSCSQLASFLELMENRYNQIISDNKKEKGIRLQG